jgi:hypothetical protein
MGCGLEDLPVDGGLPDGVVHAVEEVEEHGTDVAIGGPVHEYIVWVEFLVNVRTIEFLGKCVSSTPDYHCEDEDEDEGCFGTSGTTE